MYMYSWIRLNDVITFGVSQFELSHLVRLLLAEQHSNLTKLVYLSSLVETNEAIV